MGWGTGEKGMNWRLLHQVGGWGTTHTPDGPESQVAELPSPESDRANFTHHFRGTQRSSSHRGHRDLFSYRLRAPATEMARLSQGYLQKHPTYCQGLLALKVTSRERGFPARPRLPDMDALELKKEHQRPFCLCVRAKSLQSKKNKKKQSNKQNPGNCYLLLCCVCSLAQLCPTFCLAPIPSFSRLNNDKLLIIMPILQVKEVNFTVTCPMSNNEY